MKGREAARRISCANNLAQIGIAPERALAMATRIPAELIRRPDLGTLLAKAQADMVHLSPDWQLTRVWRAGNPLPLA